MEEESQEKILERLKPNDYFKIVLPDDDFLDNRSFSESDDTSGANSSKNEKEKYRFGQNIYEKYSSYYFSETILKLNKSEIKNINYKTDVNVNQLTVYDTRQPWFNGKIFDYLVDFCKSENDIVIFKPDYIINNIKGSKLSERIKIYEQNIQYLRNWISPDKNYDLIGEISINYLTNKKEIEQTKKYVKIIQILQKIQNDNDISIEVKKAFEKKFNLVNENEKVLVLTSDGNYESYLETLKNSDVFKENDNKIIVSDKDDISSEILKTLKESGINFIFIYTPRAYVNIKPIYYGNPKIENDVSEMKKIISILAEENNKLKEQVKELFPIKKQIALMEERINKLTEENEKLNAKQEKKEEENLVVQPKSSEVNKI